MDAALQIEVQIPAKLAGLYEPRRYKVMHGGRGGGKSHGVAEVLLEMAARNPLRILCAREIQKSMRDSVHRLLKDKVIKLGMQGFFEVLDNEIRGRNGSLFLFSGLQSHTVDSIKSFEGVDIVWVEEAHGVSKKSWDVLVPTIRKNGSEIWLTLNPDMETDETYQRFIATPSPDTWVCEINWRDNPWFPQVLDEERQKAKRTMGKDDYEHIWEGKARKVAAGAIYRYEIEALYADGRACGVPYDPRLPVHTVWDLGWNDAMAIVMVQVGGAQDIRIIDYIEDSHRTLDWYVAQLEKRPYRWGWDYLPHDGKNGNFQTGMNTEQRLKQLGRRQVKCNAALGIEEGIKLARMAFPRTYFDAKKTARLLECLKRYQRALNKAGEGNAPLHDEYSHGADAFRYVGMSVEHMYRAQQAQPTVTAGGHWTPLDREIGY